MQFTLPTPVSKSYVNSYATNKDISYRDNQVQDYLNPYCNIGSPFLFIVAEPMAFSAVTIKLPSTYVIKIDFEFMNQSDNKPMQNLVDRTKY